MKYSVVIFAHSEDDYQKCKQHVEENSTGSVTIYFCRSTQKSRIAFLKDFPDQWLFFIDADCTPEKEHLEKITSINLQTNQVIAGVYKNPMAATYLQKAHNFIANAWLVESFQRKHNHILGGAFLIFSDSSRLSLVSQPDKLFWGAEDKYLAWQLVKAGFEISLRSDFSVIHNTSKSVKHFFRRAWFQGYNDYLIDDQNSKEKTNLTYWLSELVQKGLWLSPAILVHFLVLQSGKLFQKILRTHN